MVLTGKVIMCAVIIDPVPVIAHDRVTIGKIHGSVIAMDRHHLRIGIYNSG